MPFSTSPLTPDQSSPTDGETWRRAAQRVLSAVTEAMPQIPSPAPLMPDAPTEAPGPGSMPDPPGSAITAYLGGGIEGKVLLVVGADLVTALAGTPFGDVEPAQALTPALETFASALGGRLEGSATAIDLEDCLGVLTGGTTVLVPLLAGESVHVLIGVSLSETATSRSAAGGPTAGSAATSWGIDMLRDVEMEVTCELGRTRMTVRQLLALAPGDVVELDRLAGSPADLLVNGTLLARGEVVVVDESFGLRITEIVTKDAPGR
ncbi:MAG: flagellar motor switch protein FliN [Actinomycetota bacterium]|nr:flagellar motor switch protein FliN [Actinomycetota bacterium]